MTETKSAKMGIEFSSPTDLGLRLNRAVIHEASPGAVDMALEASSPETQRCVREQAWAQAKAGAEAESLAGMVDHWTTLWLRIQSSTSPSWRMPTDIKQIRDKDKRPILEAVEKNDSDTLRAIMGKMPVTYVVVVSEIARQITGQANEKRGEAFAGAQQLLAGIPGLEIKPVLTVSAGPTIRPELRARLN